MRDPVQLNTDIQPEELLKVKRDVLEVGTSLKAYVAAALTHFRQSLTIDQRRKRFERSPKIMGRSIKV